MLRIHCIIPPQQNNLQTAYNFFYRDERRRIQEQQKQAVTGAAAAASKISRTRHGDEDASLSSATAAVNVLSSSSSSSGPRARSTEQSSSSTTSDSDKSGTIVTGGSIVQAPLPLHLQSLQQAGTSDTAIAALVEHQSSFRDTSREIARRWQVVDIGEFDRYQRLAEQDAERYKEELAEYEAERKRREAVVRKVEEAEAAEDDKQACAPSSNSVCTGKVAGSSKNMMSSNDPTPSTANDLHVPPSSLPWSNQYQPQKQAESSFKNTPEVSLPILATSSQRPPSNDNQMQLVISQLLRNQQWLLNAQRPSYGPIQATTLMQQRPAEELANAQQGDFSSGQSKIIQMLIQQNQRLQMEVKHLRQREEIQTQLIQIEQLREQQQTSALSSAKSTSSSLSPTSRPGAKDVPNPNSKAKAKRSRKRPSSNVELKKSPKTSDTMRAPSKKKTKRTTKKKAKEERTADDDISVDEASKGLLSLRSRVSGSSDAGLSSPSTPTSIKAKPSLETKDKKDEISDISTSASDAKKLTHKSSSDTASADKGTNTKTKGNSDEDVSDISASGESNDNPKKRHRDEAASNEIPDVSSTGGSPSLGSSSPGGAGERNVAENAEKGAAPPTKKVRVVDPSPKRVTRRSGSDSGELSSESSWGANEDSSNNHARDVSNTSDRMSSLNGSKAGALKNSRMYTSEMSSVSASGSDSGNASSHGSDDGMAGDGKDTNKA